MIRRKAAFKPSRMRTKFWLGVCVAATWLSAALAQTVSTIITPAGGLLEPNSIAVDSANNYYLTDSANNRVIKYVPNNGALSVLAGLAGDGNDGFNDGLGVAARFSYPKGIVLARGGLVVADSGNHVLRFIALDGTVSTLAGTPGTPGFNNGPAAVATFSFPSGLAADPGGNIYVADTKNNAIRLLDIDNKVSTLAAGFYEPEGVALGDNGQIIVADTRNHSIKLIQTNQAVTLIAGRNSRFLSGTNDSLVATNALFNNPRGVLWLGGTAGLLVTDSGNQSLRRVYFNTNFNAYSTETFAGAPGLTGSDDGALPAARFNNPIGAAEDLVGDLLVVDSANNSLRQITTGPPQPPVTNPSIGKVDLVIDPNSGQQVTKLTPIISGVFNNDIVIAILADPTVSTYFTSGPTPPSPLQDSIPSPSQTTGSQPPAYADGESQLPPSMLNPQPDMTIKAISTANGRRPSQVVQARFQFTTSNPSIVGDNPASFVVQDGTKNAQIYYTTDGSDPTNSAAFNPAVIGPIASGTSINLNIGSQSVVFSARAFRDSYAPSEISRKTFTPTNFIPNRITFGFDSGVASSAFIGSSGQTFYAPVTLSLIPGQTMYSLQFNVTAAATNGAPAIAPGAVGFQSMLSKPKPDQPFQGSLITIPPAMFVGYFTNVIVVGGQVVTNLSATFTNLLVTNATQNLVGVGWLERAGFQLTNLFDTTAQDLITFSGVHDFTFNSADGKVVVGAYSFNVPPTATNGQTYIIQLGRPSATEDGATKDVFIDTPTNGSLTAASPINATKLVTVGQAKYLVGDVLPLRWINAGDFGDNLLLNNDVLDVFASAIYHLNTPAPGSDFFDAMDACCGAYTNVPGQNYLLFNTNVTDPATLNALATGNDTVINTIGFGDGVLDVSDVFVTFRRSIDPSLTWFRRFWTNGVRAAETATNQFRGAAVARLPGAGRSAGQQANLTGADLAAAQAAVTFVAGDAIGAAGQTVQIPVTAQIAAGYNLKILMLNLAVYPLQDSPPLTQAVQFTPVDSLGSPTLSDSQGAANYAGAWLNTGVTGLAGSAAVGVLKLTIPAGAGPNAAYAVRFEHASALGVPTPATHPGLITLSDRSQSTWNDGIPDSWRLRFFDSTTSVLAAANADPDGDGASNYDEWLAGTDPSDPHSRLHLFAGPAGVGSGLFLAWPTVSGKRYVLESASALTPGAWSSISTNILGDGLNAQFLDATTAGASRFYRLRLVP